MKQTYEPENTPPPVLKRWPRLYGLVMMNLVFWLALFYIIRRIFE